MIEREMFHNNYSYRVKRGNNKDSFVHLWVIKSHPSIITLKDYILIIKYNDTDHYYDPKPNERNVQNVLTGLKCHPITDIDQSMNELTK